MLYLGHRAEQLCKQLHMKRGIEERERIGVEDHIIFVYDHRRLVILSSKIIQSCLEDLEF